MPRLREADASRRLANGGPNYVEALARGLSVIGAFGQGRRQLSLSDVARATSLPKASVRRMLHTLITLQLADTDGRVFRLTPRVLGLAGDYLGSNKVSTVVQPACERIQSRDQFYNCGDPHIDRYTIGDKRRTVFSIPRLIDWDRVTGFQRRHFAFTLSEGYARSRRGASHSSGGRLWRTVSISSRCHTTRTRKSAASTTPRGTR